MGFGHETILVAITDESKAGTDNREDIAQRLLSLTIQELTVHWDHPGGQQVYLSWARQLRIVHSR